MAAIRALLVFTLLLVLTACPNIPSTGTLNVQITGLPSALNAAVTVAGPGGFAQTLMGGSLSPNYATCPSPLYAAPSGSGTCTFTLTTGSEPVTVDHMRFQVLNTDHSTLLFKALILVSYTFQ